MKDIPGHRPTLLPFMEESLRGADANSTQNLGPYDLCQDKVLYTSPLKARFVICVTPFTILPYSRKSRGKDGGVPKSSGHAAHSLLRLCPTLEARISDLRRDNTAAARFLNKAQVC